MQIFPTSPAPAGMTRDPVWNEEVIQYDSGLQQAATAWVQPLYMYSIPFVNFPISKINSLHQFWNDRKGEMDPFLFKDPYNYHANSVSMDVAGDGVGSGFYFYDVNSYRIIPDSGNFIANDGAEVNGTDFIISLDNGFATWQNAPGSSTLVCSFEFFKKVRFSRQYSEASKIWEIFSGKLAITELPIK